MTKTLTRTITAALLIAALAVPAAAATTTDIGVEKAKEAALSHAGVAESDTVFLIAEADYDDGRKEYEMEFYAGGTEYDYTIDAASGRVLKFDTELEWYSADDDAGYGWQECHRQAEGSGDRPGRCRCCRRGRPAPHCKARLGRWRAHL